MLHRGIFRQWRRAIHMVEYFVSGVALSMLRRGIFHQWRHAINIPSQDIFGIKWRELYSWHYQCCIVENYKYISSMAEYFDDALSIFDREKFQKWHNVTSWNISSMASHYQCCMAEYFDIILSILDRGKFQKWHNVTSWNISPVASHHQCYIAEYFDVALSILNRGKFQKWHNKCYIAEYFINVVAVSIWQNISSVASHYQYCMAEYFDIILSILDRGKFQK